MNEEKVKWARDAAFRIKKYAPKAEAFVTSDFGQYFLAELDAMVQSHVERGNDLTDKYALRSHDRAEGIRIAKELLYDTIKRRDSGELDQLESILKTATDPQE